MIQVGVDCDARLFHFIDAGYRVSIQFETE